MKNLITLALSSLFVLTALSSTALACENLKRKDVEKALGVLRPGTTVVKLYSTKPRLTIETVSVARSMTVGDVDYYRIFLNEQPINSDHTYVVVNDKTVLNVAQLIGCGNKKINRHSIKPVSFDEARIN